VGFFFYQYIYNKEIQIMKNIITEELGYMKYLFGYQRGVVISEQAKTISKKEKNVLDAYELIVDGSAYMGTNPQKIVNGLNMIKDKTELNRLLTLFKDKRTGYDTFGKMIKGEFESGNQNDLNKITAKLKSLKWNYTGKETPENFKTPGFTPITKPLTDAPPAAAAPAVPESTNKEHWEDVVKYYEGNKDPNWKFDEKGKDEWDSQMKEYIDVSSTDTNDDDAVMRFFDDGILFIGYKGRSESIVYSTWEWDGTKPIIKFKDISKNASGYVQPTDTDWSAVTEDNKIIGLNAKGPLVKDLQHWLIYQGYSGNTGNPITTDVVGCDDDTEKCDGVYGKSTKEMVKQFQKDNGLEVDGIFGKQTYYALF
jgi:hypothetical protein